MVSASHKIHEPQKINRYTFTGMKHDFYRLYEDPRYSERFDETNFCPFPNDVCVLYLGSIVLACPPANTSTRTNVLIEDVYKYTIGQNIDVIDVNAYCNPDLCH